MANVYEKSLKNMDKIMESQSWKDFLRDYKGVEMLKGPTVEDWLEKERAKLTEEDSY